MEIHKKILACADDIKSIAKTQQAEGFAFRGIDDVYNALNPIFKKHGIFTTTEVLSHQVNSQGKTIVQAKFTFFAEDGSSISSTTIGEAVDKGDKGSTIAQSIAHRIALTQMFMIPTDDGLPWLSLVQFTRALERIKSGDFQLYFKIESQYRMKTEEKIKLQQAISLTNTKK